MGFGSERFVDGLGFLDLGIDFAEVFVDIGLEYVSFVEMSDLGEERCVFVF